MIRTFYALGLMTLVGGVVLGISLWLRAEALREGRVADGLLADMLYRYNSSELSLAAAVVASAGLVGFLIFGSVGQILAMHRDRAINSALQVFLLEDILELNEEAAKASDSRIELCEGCGRLGALQQIESGQWVCRECRRQFREA